MVIDMYFHRILEAAVLNVHKTFKVLYLGGPRQVGKTTLLKHVAKNRGIHYVSLDDLSSRRLAQVDPELFLEQHPAPLLIDEVQYAPQLFPYIKLKVDASPQKGRYWLTGSQQFSLIKNIQESLAGRVGILTLLGFSYAEFNHTQRKNSFYKFPFLTERVISKKNPPGHSRPSDSLSSLYEFILRGSFPELWQPNSATLNFFYNSYLQTYIDRDLREMFGVTKTSEFHTFLQLCAARTGQILNVSELARDAGISVHAAHEWLSILEATMHVYLLRPYHNNLSKRLIKAPKLYFLDTGLAAFLTQWKNVETLRSGAMAGAFFETFVVAELIKSYLFRGFIPPLYYFRDKQGHEVDVLIEENQKLYPIEIKQRAKAHADDFKGIEYLRKLYPRVGVGALVGFSPEIRPWDRNNFVVPFDQIK